MELIRLENIKAQKIANDKIEKNKELNTIRNKQTENNGEAYRLNKELEKRAAQLAKKLVKKLKAVKPPVAEVATEEVPAAKV